MFLRGFLTSLKGRGLYEVQLVISYQHAGLPAAIGRCFQGSTHQRCRVHLAPNLLALVPKAQMDIVAAVFRTIFDQPDPDTMSERRFPCEGSMALLCPPAVANPSPTSPTATREAGQTPRKPVTHRDAVDREPKRRPIPWTQRNLAPPHTATASVLQLSRRFSSITASSLMRVFGVTPSSTVWLSPTPSV